MARHIMMQRNILSLGLLLTTSHQLHTAPRPIIFHAQSKQQELLGMRRSTLEESLKQNYDNLRREFGSSQELKKRGITQEQFDAIMDAIRLQDEAWLDAQAANVVGNGLIAISANDLSARAHIARRKLLEELATYSDQPTHANESTSWWSEFFITIGLKRRNSP